MAATTVPSHNLQWSVVHETAAKGDSRLPTGTVTMAVVTATLLAAAATTFMAGNKINGMLTVITVD
ncbi:hypothetical protein E2C01_036504 [Portunus trituberculatus]|uniref:Uncharacterized protein n=1 Tax=Portunus trituberculatus TaxID=210409 RepID=A0A5B7FCN1_PORTR|nr:hypothetical protein [Portunus trituberculatus]